MTEMHRRTVLHGVTATAAGAALGSAAPAGAQTASFVVPPVPRATLPVTGTSQLYPVRRIYCVGRNYLEHIRELGNDEREPPFFFQKPLDSLVADGGAIPYPSLTRNYHHEIELVVALKSGGRNIPAAAALTHVYGYAVGLDMTRRDLQRTAQEKRQPWEIGKGFDHSAPCAAIHPVERVGHIQEGAIKLAIDGQMKQDSDLKLMIWKVPEIIANLSTQYELAAGDIIYTGTPHGVGPVRAGETMVGEIAGLGTLTIRVTQALG